MSKKSRVARPTEINVEGTKPEFLSWLSKDSKVRVLNYLTKQVGCEVALFFPCLYDVDTPQSESTNLTKIEDGFIIKTGPPFYIEKQLSYLKSKGCIYKRYELI